MSIVATGFANALSRTWWALLLRGIIAVIFGIFALTHPALSLQSLALVFGVYALADGVGGIVTAVTGRNERKQWLLLLVWSLVSAGVGLVTLLAPGITTVVLLFCIAMWMIVTGVLEIITALSIRKEIEGEWRLIGSGLISVIAGIVLLSRPLAGAVAFIWLIGIYTIAFGVLLIILAFEVRTLRNRVKERIPQPAV
jgi:uncharacterized membrane protein HdeD (DUF308 family)